jgi:hypothetical protein
MSGMNRVAEAMSLAERQLGLDSYLVNVQETVVGEWDKYLDADIFVAHTHFPNEIRYGATKKYKLVFPIHGTIEYIFNSAIEDGQRGYGHGDGWMLFQYWLQNADVIVTFWPRHQAIVQTMVDKNTRVNLVPLGIDKAHWSGGKSKGKFAGDPSLFTAENCHSIKWPFDLFIAWPMVYREVPRASLHANYLPLDKHRWFFPLINRNGASYGSYVSPLTFPHDELPNVLKSVDFQIGLVQKGDFNRLSLESNAAGCKTISYEGNPYSWFWVREGDQRRIAQDLISILKGEVEPRVDRLEPPDAKDMAEAMMKVYESVL